MKQRLLTIIGIIIFALGITGLIPYMYTFAQDQLGGNQPNSGQSVALPQLKPAEKKSSAISGPPIRVQVPSLNIDLALVDGYYNKSTGAWTLTKTRAQFAILSALPNNKTGNTLIYGHSTMAVFQRLHDIKPGTKVIIYTGNGHVFTYRYQNNEVVDPSNTDIFAYKGKPRLTLQTCTGVWFENRKFFYFSLIDAK